MEAATAVALGTTGDNSTAGAQKIGHATQQHDVLELDAAHHAACPLLTFCHNPPIHQCYTLLAAHNALSAG